MPITRCQSRNFLSRLEKNMKDEADKHGIPYIPRIEKEKQSISDLLDHRPLRHCSYCHQIGHSRNSCPHELSEGLICIEKKKLCVSDGVDCYIQFGSKTVKNLSERNGWTEMFEQAGVKMIDPGCGACIGAGPGVSSDSEQVTVSAINRNFQGRSGPGKLYLASPLTVMASAFTGKITAWRPDLFE